MRIKQISVTGLFGIFDHVIPLNLDERITIIHAPNGYGKTIILKMLNGLFNQEYNDLRNIPYETFRIDFDDDSYLEVSKNQDSDKKPLHLIFYRDNEEIPKVCDIGHSQKDLDDYINHTRISMWKEGEDFPTTIGWINARTGTELTSEEILESSSFLSYVKKKNEAWVNEIQDSFNVYLIESQRLLSFKSPTPRQFSENLPLPTVKAYSNELVQKVKGSLTEYATISQSLDRSFPTRVIKQKPSGQLTDDALRSKLNELERNRSRLVEIGLLEKDEDQNFQIQSEEIDSSTRNVLTIYIKDVEKKLQVFGDLADKIDLFKRIINLRFSYKEITISHEQGFLFKSKYPGNNRNSSEFLSPASLSSGEQHELILLYELLFKVKENSLVLIDEPELSLHVGWQVNFLRDLQEITKLAKIDVLIATHSPSLINDRWDLTVELKGVSQ